MKQPSNKQKPLFELDEEEIDFVKETEEFLRLEAIVNKKMSEERLLRERMNECLRMMEKQRKFQEMKETLLREHARVKLLLSSPPRVANNYETFVKSSNIIPMDNRTVQRVGQVFNHNYLFQKILSSPLCSYETSSGSAGEYQFISLTFNNNKSYVIIHSSKIV